MTSTKRSFSRRGLLVFSPRPGAIVEDIAVPFGVRIARLISSSQPEFIDLKRHMLDRLRRETGAERTSYLQRLMDEQHTEAQTRITTRPYNP